MLFGQALSEGVIKFKRRKTSSQELFGILKLKVLKVVDIFFDLDIYLNYLMIFYFYLFND